MIMQNVPKQLISKLFDELGEMNVKSNELMSLHTTFRIGGPADLFLTPPSINSLIHTLNLCLKYKTPYFILGKGSNLIVSDKGIRGVVISMEKLVFAFYKGESVYAGSGFELTKLSKHTSDRGLSGLEFAIGIPGSVGGAVYMNAGAYEGEISQILVSTEFLCIDNNLPDGAQFIRSTLMNKEHDFSYRHSIFQEQEYIILGSQFKLKSKNKQSIQRVLNELTKAREDKQPLDQPSAGSVFRRPKGFFTGQLIQECGLKSYRINDAAVSDKHCGFIVNLGKATAKDVLALIEHIQSVISKRYGINLQTEIRFIGEK